MKMTDKHLSVSVKYTERMWEECVLQIRCLADYDKQGETLWSWTIPQTYTYIYTHTHPLSTFTPTYVKADSAERATLALQSGLTFCTRIHLQYNRSLMPLVYLEGYRFFCKILIHFLQILLTMLIQHEKVHRSQDTKKRKNTTSDGYNTCLAIL